MTVGELIEMLKSVPANYEVDFDTDYGSGVIVGIRSESEGVDWREIYRTENYRET